MKKLILSITIVFTFCLFAQGQNNKSITTETRNTSWSDLSPYQQKRLRTIADTSQLIFQGQVVNAVTIFDADSIEYVYIFLQVLQVLKSDIPIGDTVIMRRKVDRYRESDHATSVYTSLQAMYFTHIVRHNLGNIPDSINLNYQFIDFEANFNIGFGGEGSSYAGDNYHRLSIPNYRTFVEFCKKLGLQRPIEWDFKTIKRTVAGRVIYSLKQVNDSIISPNPAANPTIKKKRHFY